ncbi:MAG: EamA family transporter [Candidatus Binatia bacterium]
MHYLPLSLFALACYSLVAPLVKLATQHGVPPQVAVVFTNTVLVFTSLALSWTRGIPLTASLSAKPLGMLLVAGVLLGLSVSAYYIALSRGPISVVVPIFGLFIVSSSIAGAVLFGETLTPQRLLGILCALAAIYLVSR